MVRFPSIFQNNNIVKGLKTPVLAAFIATAFVLTPGNISQTQAGNSGQSVKHLKAKPSKSTVRTVRLGGENLSLRPVSGSSVRGINSRRMGGESSRTVLHRRSVLDGRYGDIVTRQLGGKGKRFDNIRRYGKIEYGSSKTSRSGVVYNSGQSLRNKKRTHQGLQQIAGGNNTGIVSRKLSSGKNSHSHGLREYTKGELIVIGAAVTGFYEIAGGGQGAPAVSNGDDCAYGTYCTIDLGGPKIITYNDAGDIKDGELTNDEEYLQEYGAK